jgi:hypothetical protein
MNGINVGCNPYPVIGRRACTRKDRVVPDVDLACS